MNSLLSLRKATLAILTLTALVVALAPSASATSPVPFKGYANAVITSPPTSTTLTANATGKATYLGAFTRKETLLLDPTTGAFTGKVVFTAANGDRLCASIVGGFTSPTTAAGEYTFTGGTGRFRTATGRATFSATAVAPGRFAITFQGTIQY